MIGLPVAVILVAGVGNARRTRLLGTSGRTTYGRVTDMGSSSDDMGSATYWVRVQYNDDGLPASAKVTVGNRDRERYRSGQRVLLTYVPGRPSIVRLDS
jgi:hypothetical protein